MPPSTVTFGGVSGAVVGYLYSIRTSAGPPICATYWLGTNSSRNISYQFEFSAPQSE